MILKHVKRKNFKFEDCDSVYSKDYCENSVWSSTAERCALINNKCTKQPKTCADYSSEGDIKACESIVLSQENEKCEMVHAEDCVSSIKYCSEYKRK